MNDTQHPVFKIGSKVCLVPKEPKKFSDKKVPIFRGTITHTNIDKKGNVEPCGTVDYMKIEFDSTNFHLFHNWSNASRKAKSMVI